MALPSIYRHAGALNGIIPKKPMGLLRRMVPPARIILSAGLIGIYTLARYVSGEVMAGPMYWRIAQDLRQEIECGKLRPGQQLPTELELRERYGTSRNTIRDAVKWLTNRALVETRPGQGTFVVERQDSFVTTLSADAKTGLGGGEGVAAESEVNARGHTVASGTPRVEILRADDTIAGRLDVPTGTQVLSRHQPRYIDDTPWSLQTSFYPMELVTRGALRLIAAEDIAEGTVTYLHEQLGLVQAGYRDTILVRSPDESEAKFFRLPDDGRISVVVILRTGYADSPDGLVPFRVTVSVYPADRNQFIMNSGAVPDELVPSRPRPSPSRPGEFASRSVSGPL
jgi:GntR family transcriptional regulator